MRIEGLPPWLQYRGHGRGNPYILTLPLGIQITVHITTRITQGRCIGVGMVRDLLMCYSRKFGLAVVPSLSRRPLRGMTRFGGHEVRRRNWEQRQQDAYSLPVKES